ncbi:hypothetical protein VNI00_000187 [Paramarasmius palmivorus]|uniref:Phytase-like domain-containing protein n=1 Tax=Paramarasmius palmivorus TaxID=297713 RepID=A0AAW0EFJ5_9AGAR
MFERNDTKTTGLDGLAVRPAQSGFPQLIDADPVMPIPSADFNHLSLDVEGLAAAPDGSYWISDEYGPYIYRFSADGHLIHTIQPPAAFLPMDENGDLTFTSDDDPATGRAANSGFEGLTLDYDSKILYAMLQAATIQDGGDDKSTSSFTRLVAYDVSDDTKRPALVGEWVVPLPRSNSKGNTRKCSEILFVSKNVFFALSRDGDGRGGKPIFSVFAKATDIHGTKYDDPANPVAPKGKLDKSITPATYVSFVDYIDDDQLARFGLHNGGDDDETLIVGKWESLALAPAGDPSFPDDYFLFTAADNDFISTHGVSLGVPFDAGKDVDNQISSPPLDPHPSVQMSSKEPSVTEKRSLDDVAVLDKERNGEDVLAESDYTEEQYKQILRKIDRYLLPLMWVAYGVQQADKTGISTQAVFGIREDTGLVGQQFSWLSTIFYLAYMIFEFPSSYMMQRVSVGKTLSVLMFLWGIIVLCTGFGNVLDVAASTLCLTFWFSLSARNFADLMALRFLQGAFECTISPSFLLIIATWYKTQEHSLRSIIWGTANAGFGIITNLCMYAIGLHAQRHGGLAAWKGISFFLGAITIVLSVFCWFLLGTPREVSWISPEERRIVQARIVNNRTGTDAQKRREWKKDQIIEAFTDPSTWFLFCSQILAALPNGGVTSFGNLVYKSFGFTSLETVLYNIPRDGASIIWFLFVGWASSRYPNIRFFLMLFAILPGFIGMLAMALLPDDLSYRWIKFGMFLMTMTVNVNGLMLWLFIPSNIAGRTKKSIVSSILFVGYCTGNAAGSQFFRAKDAPRYVPAIIACAICLALQFLFILSWRFYLVFLNRSREAAAAAQGLTPEKVKGTCPSDYPLPMDGDINEKPL